MKNEKTIKSLYRPKYKRTKEQLKELSDFGKALVDNLNKNVKENKK